MLIISMQVLGTIKQGSVFKNKTCKLILNELQNKLLFF